MLRTNEQGYELVRSKIMDLDYRCNDWLPSWSDITNIIEPNIDDFVPLIMWILGTSSPSKNEDDERKKEHLSLLLSQNVRIDKTEKTEDADAMTSIDGFDEIEMEDAIEIIESIDDLVLLDTIEEIETEETTETTQKEIKK